MCKVSTKVEEDFFEFASERVLYIGINVTDDVDEELDRLTKEVQRMVDKELWRKYELKDSLYHDKTMYYAYKQGFIDALRLFAERKD